MAHTVTRQVVDAFYDAYTTGDRDKLAAMLHDDVAWSIRGPVAVLLFCGERHGKAQVLELASGVLQSVLADLKVTHDSVVIDGDDVATLNRLTARRRSDGRTIGYRFAHFIRFKDGKVIETLSIIDTFDAAEQMLGHSLAVADDAPATPRNLVLL
ncbi:nuclear transport factor 2 family protein [Undibacter mobilis]|uniref:Nuclear transport factor 2 family protein n=1 Tax=Undibacter mobilis TaxID=2292256 RepID=A0A371BBE6_9BRAD|nr:nuclear transport factor 2 family protein [Undibacter mobilis]RDV04908.1 nuclear transport factor 2 family protein [Undibacter mobilis]